MLCVQMLHVSTCSTYLIKIALVLICLQVVEKHGIFAASDHDNLVSQLQAGPPDREGSWKAWVRVESIKRYGP